MMIKILAYIAMIILWIPQACASGILNGHQLSLGWVVPFCGVILSLALCPIIMPKIWSHHYGKINALWTLLTLLAVFKHYNITSSINIIIDVGINHLFPFIMLISVLYIVTGNIRIDILMPATPLINSILLITGMVCANLIGTTGASMLFIQPLLRMNSQRRFQQHSIIFFIFAVSNIGGCLTPLGDPPLFIGFLHGVSPMWLAHNMWVPLAIVAVPLITIYFLIDSYLYKYKEKAVVIPLNPIKLIKIYGGYQWVFIAAIIITIIINGLWTWDQELIIAGYHKILWKDVIRDTSLLIIAIMSYHTGCQSIRQQNNFSWQPLIEISKIFTAIFITAMPVIAILQAGHNGVLSGIVTRVTTDGHPMASAYFWLVGLLSAFLDNAPTYLIFFNIAGANAQYLMSTLPEILTAISTGAVFMGALSYIGNAPNFMVKSIAEQHNIRMPGFFGYMLWSCGILLPLFIILHTILF